MSLNVGAEKIDFHATTSFRDAFPQAGAGLGSSRPVRPAMPGIHIDYEKKIEASRDQSFIENLLDQNS